MKGLLIATVFTTGAFIGGALTAISLLTWANDYTEGEIEKLLREFRIKYGQ